MNSLEVIKLINKMIDDTKYITRRTKIIALEKAMI